MLFVEGVSSSYVHIVSLSFRGQHGSNTIAQFVIEPWAKIKAMKVIPVSNDTMEGLKFCLWDISWNLLILFLNNHRGVQWGHLEKTNQMNHNKQGPPMCEPDERESLSPPSILASAVADLALDTCTAGKRCTIVAAMASCFGRGDRQCCAHPKLQGNSTFFHWNII